MPAYQGVRSTVTNQDRSRPTPHLTSDHLNPPAPGTSAKIDRARGGPTIDHGHPIPNPHARLPVATCATV